MPLSYLVPLVIVGITIIVLSVHLSGVSKRRPITGQSAKWAFAEEFPEVHVNRVILCANQRAAFLETDGEPLGLVEAFGAKHITRCLKQGDVTSVETRADTGLSVRYKDLTKRRGRYGFDNIEDQDRVQYLLERLIQVFL